MLSRDSAAKHSTAALSIEASCPLPAALLLRALHYTDNDPETSQLHARYPTHFSTTTNRSTTITRAPTSIHSFTLKTTFTMAKKQNAAARTASPAPVASTTSAAPAGPSTTSGAPSFASVATTPSSSSTRPSSRSTAPSSPNQNNWNKVIQNLTKHYLNTTPQQTKLIDAFQVFLVVVGALQFLYCILAGNYPFNAFLSGFSATVGQFVLTASLRIQTTEANKKDFPSVSPERAFADYVVCSLILHFFCVNFIN
ncbi:DAD family-domain-containing protein [Cladorrhinum sp. PSN259]|nr:DAD family-domain-containing protein [Cladorrhinum sp. PSN259]